MTLTRLQQQFVTAAKDLFPSATELTADQVREVCDKGGLNLPQWLTNDRQYRVKRGVYRLPAADAAVPTTVAAAVAPAATVAEAVAAAPAPVTDAALAFTGGASLVPTLIANFQAFGAYRDLVKVIKSNKFYPVYITGRKGYGKTTAVVQACAENGREFFRANITAETTEDDLLGGFRLLNGETKWVDGPVIVAMKRGGILLLDEVDLGTSKIMALQPVLEGKGVFLKKTNTWVQPAKGFNVIATGNTKGNGDDTGRYLGTNPMNAAFLDRMAEITEQVPPPEATELKIVKGLLKSQGYEDQDDFAVALVKWANTTRQRYEAGDATEEISTRRLEYAIAAYGVYGERLKAVEKTVSGYPEEVKAAFVALYKALDAEATAELKAANEAAAELGKAPTEAQVTVPVAAPAPTVTQPTVTQPFIVAAPAVAVATPTTTTKAPF
jgi:MoxR-like ATPase